MSAPIESSGPVVHGVECHEAWRELRDCPHELETGPLRLVNPETGAELKCERVEVVGKAFELPAPPRVWVRIFPSVRPGKAFDLALYEAAWLVR